MSKPHNIKASILKLENRAFSVTRTIPKFMTVNLRLNQVFEQVGVRLLDILQSELLGKSGQR